jgi:hypothetical protein
LQSSLVQGSPSSQVMGGFTHPLALSQESVVQALPSLQPIASWEQRPVPGLQASIVQASLSSQPAATFVHPVNLSQESIVQRLPSSQLIIS